MRPRSGFARIVGICARRRGGGPRHGRQATGDGRSGLGACQRSWCGAELQVLHVLRREVGEHLRRDAPNRSERGDGAVNSAEDGEAALERALRVAREQGLVDARRCEVGDGAQPRRAMQMRVQLDLGQPAAESAHAAWRLRSHQSQRLPAACCERRGAPCWRPAAC